MIKLLNESEVRNEIVRIVQNYLTDTTRVYLFGSRADGTFKITSDYDICIDAGKRIAGDIMQNIRNELEELNIMQKVDVSDFYSLNENFQEKIRLAGVLLADKN